MRSFRDELDIFVFESQGDLEQIKTFLDLNKTKNNALELVFAHAAANGFLDVVRHCVSLGVNLDFEGGAALRWSAAAGHLKVIRFLDEQGVDLHQDLGVALNWAVLNNHPEVVHYIVERGADVNIDDGECLMLSAEGYNNEMTDYLISHGADIELALKKATRHGVECAVQFLKMKQEQKFLERLMEIDRGINKVKTRL